MNNRSSQISPEACLDLFQLAEEVAHVGYWMWDIASGEVVWSKTKIRIYGEDSTTFKPSFDKFLAVLDEPTRQRVMAEIDAVLKGEKPYYDLQHRIHLRNGRTAWIHEKGLVIRDGDGTPLRMEGIVHDITERMQLMELLRDQRRRLDYLQVHNPVSGLPGRRSLLETLAHLLASGQSFYLAMLDLADFGTLNNSHGHLFGDTVLKTLGQRLTAAYPDQVFHYNADEFAIILPAGEWSLHCERLHALVREPLEVGDHVLHLSVNMGCSRAPQDADTPDGLIRTAQTALRYLKRNHATLPGTHFLAFAPSMLETLSRRHQLAEALRNDLHAHPERFEVYYQPQVEMVSGRPVGMEALVRWNRPEEGLVNPAEFLSIAWEEGLMAQLDALVLEQALSQWRCWRQQHGALNLSVNCVISDLENPQLFEQLREAAGEAGFTLELTEAEILKCDEDELTGLAELRRLGAKISIDDFGTGYSSLRYLHSLPIDELKIDRSFVSGLPGNPQDADLVRLLKNIVDTFRLKSVVEGVENAEQAAFLTALGFRRAQGFLYGRPMNVEAMDAWLQQAPKEG